jgi:hypothetical protein
VTTAPPELAPRPDGLITVAQAARLARRSETTIRQWTRRGWIDKRTGERRKLPVARRDGWLLLLEPREVAIAELANRAYERHYESAGAAA